MGKYNSAVITTVGANVIAQALSGTELTWTVMRTSSTAIPAGTDPATLSSLTGIEQVSNITDATVYGNDVLQVSARFANTSISVAYLIQTVGIYGQLEGGAETLIAVMTAVNPDEVSEYDPDSPSAFIFNTQLAIQNAPNVTMNVNDTGTATVADLNRKVDIQRGNISNTVVTTITTSTAAYPTVTAGDTVAAAVGKVNKSISDLSENKLDKTGDAANATIGSSTASSAAYPIPAVGDSFKVILGKIRKFFSDIKAAYTNVSVSGRKITFTTAAGGTKEITTQDTTYGLASTSANGLLRQLDSNTSHYMRGDGTWQTPPNTTYSDFTGATASAAGEHGLVPAPAAGRNTYYLRGDKSWQPPQNNVTTTAEGLVLDARVGKWLNDKIDVIGNIFTGSMSSAKSCPANTWTAVASVTVRAGAYILFGRARCATGNANKMFSVIIGHGNTVGVMSSSVPVTIGTIGFSVSTSDTFIVTGTTTFNISVYPNSTLTIDAANITAIRIQ